jgi:hypothetical protein
MINKELRNFVIKLIGFAVLLWGIHYYIFLNFFSEVSLYLPLWSIYVFNAVTVCIVYVIINYKVSRGSEKGYNLFLMLTIGKMALAVVFLLPLISGKSTVPITEAINFFIPYFVFLTYEIIALNKFLKNQ